MDGWVLEGSPARGSCLKLGMTSVSFQALLPSEKISVIIGAEDVRK